MRTIIICCVLSAFARIESVVADSPAELPRNLRVVMENTQPLQFDRHGHLPLLILPISNSLATINDGRSEQILRDLDRRGIGYTVDWDPNNFERSLAEGLRIAALQSELGLKVCVNANACLY